LRSGCDFAGKHAPVAGDVDRGLSSKPPGEVWESVATSSKSSGAKRQQTSGSDVVAQGHPALENLWGLVSVATERLTSATESFASAESSVVPAFEVQSEVAAPQAEVASLKERLGVQQNVGAGFPGHNIPEINPSCRHQPQDYCYWWTRP